MDKKTMVIIGVGVIGAGALILMSPPPTYQPGGFAGGVSKKEDASVGPVTTETVTETTEAPALADPIYNIFFPDPSFPTIPQPAITEPWWVTSAEPPEPKKEAAPSVWESVRFTQAVTGGQRAPSYVFPSPTQLSLALSKPVQPITPTETKKEAKTATKPTLDIAKDVLKRLGR